MIKNTLHMLLSTLTDGVLRNVYVQKQNEILGGGVLFLKKKVMQPKAYVAHCVGLVWNRQCHFLSRSWFKLYVSVMTTEFVDTRNVWHKSLKEQYFPLVLFVTMFGFVVALEPEIVT